MFGNHHRGCGPRGRHFGGRGRGAAFFAKWDMDAQVAARRGRRMRMFDNGQLRLVLLALIADEPRHGYDLIRAIEERTGGAYAPSPGVVYPTLTLLAEMGLIEEAVDDSAKKLYAITEAGTAHLAENADEVTMLMGRLAELGTMRERADRSPVRRAMTNLKTALRDRMTREDEDSEVQHKIAEILDQAVRDIERL